MIILKGSEWAGTEEAYHHALAAVEALNARVPADEPLDEPQAFHVEDGVAFVNIKGPMLNVDIPDSVAAFFGITTYPGLHRQFAAIREDASVERVVLDVDSGGGQVSGLSDAVDALRELAKEKPVATYAGDMMASAAYWLGSNSQSITMSKAGAAGSIGVIAVHTSYKNMYEQAGIRPTVMRAGAKKHLGHELEEFSEEARADMQKSLDFYHQMFMQTVAENRNMTYAQVAAGIGDGRVFYGAEAQEVGLVDNIGSFASFLEGWKPKAEQPVYVKGGVVAASIGEPDMNLEEALAKVEALQGELSTCETALAAAEAKAAAAVAEKTTLEVANKALATSLASAEADTADYASALDKNITAKATALNTEVLIPEDLAGKKQLNAQLEEKFLAAFPAGGVAAVAGKQDVETKAEQAPAWARQFIK